MTTYSDPATSADVKPARSAGFLPDDNEEAQEIELPAADPSSNPYLEPEPEVVEEPVQDPLPETRSKPARRSSKRRPARAARTELERKTKPKAKPKAKAKLGMLERARPSRIASQFAAPMTYEFPLQTKEFAGPLQFTTAGVFAWYVLGTTNWEFMTLTARKDLWDMQRSRYGQIAEAMPDGVRPFRMRRTTRPYDAFEWAARLDAQSDPLPTFPGCESWNEYLAHAQAQLRSTGLDQKTTFVGFWLGPVPKPEVVEQLVSGVEHPGTEAVNLIDRLLELDEQVRDGGLNAIRATAADVAFLMHRSLSMGIPAPSNAAIGGGHWTADGFGEFLDRRAWVSKRFGQTVEVIGDLDGQVVRRHVITLSMGVMPDQTWPDRGQDAWMVSADRLGFPVEWSLNGVLMKGSNLEATAVFEADRARAIADHYAEHGAPLPPAVARAIEGAVETLDEVTEGTNRVAPRFMGTIRASVYGATEAEAISRARKLTLHYKDKLHMPLSRTLDQARVLREFVPGEPRVQKGWTRRFGVSYLAAAMPNIDAEVGSPVGAYMGYTTLSGRAFLFDLHDGPENLNMSGMMTISGGLGSGKSVIIGSAAYNSVRAGEQTLIFDPSGPLREMCDIPELAPVAAEMNLTRAAEGTLAPPQMVPVPRRENHMSKTGAFDELDYRRAVDMANAERGQLLFDSLRMELPPGLLKAREVDQTLSAAIRSMQTHRLAALGEPTRWNPRWAVQALHDMNTPLSRELWRELEDAAESSLGSLIIPSHSDLIDEVSFADKKLIVVTMPGLEPPPAGLDREEWGITERRTVPLLHLAAFFAGRIIYSGQDRSARKNVFLDENHLMARWGSGRAFNIRIARDSRKWNAGVLASSQDPEDHLSIGALDALIGGTFVGRLTTDTAAERGCRALGISPEYVDSIKNLRSGEFLHRDQLRRVAKVKIDMDWHPSLAKLKTTPGHKRNKFSAELDPTPFLDPRLFADITSQALAA